MAHQPPLRVGNASGFYGDRFTAVREMLEGGPLDVLTGDYLAELTMLILGRAKLKDPGAGYAGTFLRQMEECLALARDRGVAVVTNAGGLNPAALAGRLRDIARRLGLDVEIAHVEGDDVLSRAGELGLGRPLTANAYLGAWGIAACLRRGAGVVVTGRVTDASLVVGPAAAHFGWARDDWDALAGATVAGHVLECGAQATGGNYAFFDEIYNVKAPGFPVAEIHSDGSSVITKHAGTGGAVTTGTVTAQLLYEIGEPRYQGPDVTAHFDTVELIDDGADRVRITGAKGTPPPPTVKVGLNRLAGYRNEVCFVLTGLDIAAKAALVREQMEAAIAGNRPARVEWTRIGGAGGDAPAADTQGAASVLLRCAVLDPDRAVAGRAFSGAAVELALASYPGLTLTAPPGDGAPCGVFTAAYVDAAAIDHVAVLADGTRVPIEPSPAGRPGVPYAARRRGTAGETGPPDGHGAPRAAGHGGRTRTVPLGRVAGARSGDKGGDANIGVWARTDGGWRWLARELTEERLKELLPETGPLPVTRHLLPNLRAVNFVIEGLLGEGVGASTRFDPQGKGLGEWLRAREVEIPEELL
ncbi:MAG TPA: acyclic terpene utilization AtuA family protein [Streptosporangiaceae bacterium]